MNKNVSIQLKFNSLLEEFGLFCGPSEPTSVNGNILDLVLTNREISVDIVLDKSLPSDHFALLFDFDIERPLKQTKYRMGYHWKSVNDYKYAEIFNDVFHSALSGINGNTSAEIIDRVFDLVHTTLATVRDQIVPFKRFPVHSDRPLYFDSECVKAKCRKRKLERTLKKYPSTENEVRLESHLYFYRDLLKEKRDGFLSQRLQNESNNLRYLTFDELFKRKINKPPITRTP